MSAAGQGLKRRARFGGENGASGANARAGAPNAETLEAINDAREGKRLAGPFTRLKS